MSKQHGDLKITESYPTSAKFMNYCIEFQKQECARKVFEAYMKNNAIFY